MTVGGNVVEWHDIPTKKADYLNFPDDVSPELITVLKEGGIEQLYSHQGETREKVNRGENLVIVTGTASGKTLAYNLPVIDDLIKDRESRALYLFPTK